MIRVVVQKKDNMSSAWTALASGPLQHHQMASECSKGTCPLIPETALASGPLQDLQMASLSSMRTRPLIPGTALASCPLQDL